MRHLREPANGLTHLAGALLAVAALALMLAGR
jgi:predicted membrane channel-forming protein YqfA (hemolysin III family)